MVLCGHVRPDPPGWGAGGRACLDRFGDRCRRRTVCRTDLPSRISILNCCRYRIWNNRCILYADVSGRCCSGGDPTFLFAAILAGAVFGDNLAPVSDTTIVSATTQEADVPGVVRSRVKYSIAAAVPAVILFAIFGGGGSTTNQAAAGSMMGSVGPSGLIMLVPFALVLILALSGQHLLTSLTWGILSAIVMILLSAPGTLGDIIRFNPDSDNVVQGALVSGLTGYFNMAILILLIVGSAHVMRLGGTMAAITNGLVKWIRNSVRRAELSIWAIVALLNSSITINTAAEIAAAPFVKEIGEKYQIHRYRRANMLDAVTSALGYIF